MRFSYRIAGVVAVCLLSTPALATSTGVTGQSGKSGTTCSLCHKGGPLPTVELAGPTKLAPGETGQYTFIIRGGAAKKGGVGIAVDNAAAILQAGEGMKKLDGELVQSEPKAFSGDELRFDFSLVAPSTDVTLTLFGAGNSTNADLDTGGDRAVATKVSVLVGNGSPDAGTPDGGSGPDTGTGDEGNDSQSGCSTTGSSTVWILGMAGASLALLRRRQG
jgi:MYXO-CTERM domain-containing protein